MIGIVATDENGGIGKDNKIPWFGRFSHTKQDLKRFKEITTDCNENKQNVLIMGRKTWESIGKKLPGRLNVVISKTLNTHCFTGDYLARSKEDTINYLSSNKDIINKTFVIGGKEIYSLFYDSINTFELTILKGNYDCDTNLNLNDIYSDFRLIKTEPKENYVNLTLVRNRPPTMRTTMRF